MWRWVAAACCAAATQGCLGGGCECVPYANDGLEVDVVDQTGAPVCDVDVFVRKGAYYDPLLDDGCRWSGAWGGPGTYTVEVVRDDEVIASTTATVRVDEDDCCGHVLTTHTTVTVTE